jgi:hypothetical protein
MATQTRRALLVRNISHRTDNEVEWEALPMSQSSSLRLCEASTHATTDFATEKHGYSKSRRLVGYIGIALGVVLLAMGVFAGATYYYEPLKTNCGCTRVTIYPYRGYALPLISLSMLFFIVGITRTLLVKRQERRAKILNALSKQPKVAWKEIRTRTDITPDTLWYDLTELLNKGKIRCEVIGSDSYYSLTAPERK